MLTSKRAQRLQGTLPEKFLPTGGARWLANGSESFLCVALEIHSHIRTRRIHGLFEDTVRPFCI